MAKNEEYIFYRKNGKLMRFPKNGKTTLFRGLNQKYDPNYDKSKLDNPNGYESWTDSYDLAKEYAGENGYVYSTEVPNKELNTEDIFDENGDRSLVYWNDKPVALHGVEGEEFMLYTDHEDHDKLDYKEISSPTKEDKNKKDDDLSDLTDQEKRLIEMKRSGEFKELLGDTDEESIKESIARLREAKKNPSKPNYKDYEVNKEVDKYNSEMKKIYEGDPQRVKKLEERISLIKSIHSYIDDLGHNKDVYNKLIESANLEQLKNMNDNLKWQKNIKDEGQDNYLSRRMGEKLNEHFGDEKTNKLQNKANDISDKLREQRLQNANVEGERQKQILLNEKKKSEARLANIKNEYRTYDVLTLRKLIKEFSPNTDLSSYTSNNNSPNAYRDRLKLQNILKGILERLSK